MINTLGALLAETLRSPSDAARRLIGFNLPLELSILALLGTVAASVVVLFLMSGLQPVPLAPGTPPLGPISLAVVVASLTGLVVLGLMICGTPFGGTGTLRQTAVVVAWVQIVQLMFQLVQLVLASVSLLAAGVFGLIATVYVLWVLVHFINVLHGLNSMGRSVVVFLLAVVGVALGLSFLLTLTGLAPMTSQTL